MGASALGNDTYQLIIGTVTSIVTFVMVFIIQNSQNRDVQALQAKLGRPERGALQHRPAAG